MVIIARANRRRCEEELFQALNIFHSLPYNRAKEKKKERTFLMLLENFGIGVTSFLSISSDLYSYVNHETKIFPIFIYKINDKSFSHFRRRKSIILRGIVSRKLPLAWNFYGGGGQIEFFVNLSVWFLSVARLNHRFPLVLSRGSRLFLGIWCGNH